MPPHNDIRCSFCGLSHTDAADRRRSFLIGWFAHTEAFSLRRGIMGGMKRGRLAKAVYLIFAFPLAVIGIGPETHSDKNDCPCPDCGGQLPFKMRVMQTKGKCPNCGARHAGRSGG